MAFIDRIKIYCGGSAALVWLLTVTVIAGFALWLISAAGHLAGFSDSWISEWLAVSADPLTALTRPWTLATYLVTHLSPLHLIFNTLWLFWFGQMLADVSHNRSIVVIFLGGGIYGALVYIFSAWLSGYPESAHLTGDSAAVLSVMTAVGVVMPNRTIGLFLLGEVKIKWITIVCIAITLLGANGSGIPPQLAHLAGITFGLGWALQHKGVYQLPRLRPRPKKTKKAYPFKIDTRATIKAISQSISEEERLDQLLDKIRISGYDSLSQKEKNELNHISQKMQ